MPSELLHIQPGEPKFPSGAVLSRMEHGGSGIFERTDSLVLVPKSAVSPQTHGAVLSKWKRADYDPKPDWSLEDLKEELESISAGLVNVSLPRDTPVPENSLVVSWRALRVTADFGRGTGSFAVRWSDDSASSDDDEDVVVSRDESQVADQETVVVRTWTEQPVVSPSVNDFLLPKTELIEATLFELERERLQRIQEELRQRQQHFQAAFSEELLRSQSVQLQLKKEEVQKHELAQRSDHSHQLSLAEACDVHLSALQRDHEQRSQIEERKIRNEAAAEEARKKEITAKEELQRQFAAKLEAEGKKKAEALQQIERERVAAEIEKKKLAEAAEIEKRKQAEVAENEKRKQAAAQRIIEESSQRLETEQAATSTQALQTDNGKIGNVPKARISEKAAKREEERTTTLQALANDFRPLVSNPALKKDLKALERNIIKILQQISATQEQVRKKSTELGDLLRGPNAPGSFLMFTLANKLLSQCESQVLKLPTFAFPLAQVVVNVAVEIPLVMEAVLAKLHEVCIFTVPKYFVFSKNEFSSDQEYYKVLGYREVDDKLESTDDYVARMIAYMTFYAAITQTQVVGGNHPHGLEHAWSWCASLLNKLPANRLTASALEAFIKAAGYRLYQEYPKPFMKMMHVIFAEFIVALRKQNDPDARAVVTRLETYLHMQQFRSEPDGRRLVATDVSSSINFRA